MAEILPRCETLLDAYRQMERFTALASQGAHLTVTTDSANVSASLNVDVPDGPARRAILFWGLTNLCLVPKRLTKASVAPRSVMCAFPSPGAAAARELRTVLPFAFDAPDNRVVFDREMGNVKIPSADAELRALLAEVMEQHLEKLGSGKSFEHGLKLILRQMMNGTMPTLASLCTRMGMSQRTLQRRLSDANTSFQELLQQVLRETADSLLAHGSMTQGEIAFLLGYSEVSAFSRAYRGWTGRPPGAVYS